MEKYTMESLKKYNMEFLAEHYEIEQSDADLANKWEAIIEGSRDKQTPKAGDILRLTNEHGDYYGHAHIDRVNEDGSLDICESAYVPFMCRYDEKIKDVRLSTSGGAWCSVPAKKCVLVGQEFKKFQDWGHCGACAHGTIQFIALVNVWEYKAPDPRFGEYTTQFYNKQYISIQSPETMEKRQSNYKYLGDGNAWETDEEYENYKKLYNGVEFDGYMSNQKILFTYKENRFYNVSSFKYESLNLPQYIILSNGSKYIAKVSKDQELKQIFIYLCDDYKIDYDYRSDEQIKKYKAAKLYSKFNN